MNGKFVHNFLLLSSLNLFPPVRMFPWRHFSLHNDVPGDRISEIREGYIIALVQAGCSPEVCVQPLVGELHS